MAMSRSSLPESTRGSPMTFYPWSFRVSPWTIESVRVTGIFNYATYPDKAAVYEILGFGKPPEAYRWFGEGTLPMPALRVRPVGVCRCPGSGCWYHRPARYRSTRRLCSGGHREPRLRRRARGRPRHDGPRHARQTIPAHRRRHPHRTLPDPADLDGRSLRHRGHWRGSGLHQHVGRPALGQTVTTADFRTGHPPPRRGDRDRQTWPRQGDQATAGRTPHRTEDRHGHTTGQAPTSTRPCWQARQFRSTATHTMDGGPPENTRHQRPTPFGPQQPSRTHTCSLMRNSSPSMRCEFEMADDHDHDLGARMAGASRMVNAIPAVCAAPPGLLSAPGPPAGYRGRSGPSGGRAGTGQPAILIGVRRYSWNTPRRRARGSRHDPPAG